MPEEEIGLVSDFFSHPVVAAIELTAGLKKGDKIRFKGHTTDLEMIIESMQIDNQPVEQARAGDSVGIKVPKRVRKHDKVFRIT